MSIHIMDHVWGDARHKGSALLLLLAIADNANDQGIAWPSVPTLAKKTRLSVRDVQYLLRDLEAPGAHGEPPELEILTCAGPKGCNLYRVIVPQMRDCPRCQKAWSEGWHRWGAKFAPCTDVPGAKSAGGGATAIAPEPSVDPSVCIAPERGPEGEAEESPPSALPSPAEQAAEEKQARCRHPPHQVHRTHDGLLICHQCYALLLDDPGAEKESAHAPDAPPPA